MLSCTDGGSGPSLSVRVSLARSPESRVGQVGRLALGDHFAERGRERERMCLKEKPKLMNE